MIYARRGTKVVGPFTIERIEQGLASGQLSSSDLFSLSASGPWLPYAEARNRSVAPPTSGAGERSELWELICEVSQKLYEKIREDRSATKADRKRRKVDAASERTHSEGLISSSFVYVSVTAIAIGGFLIWNYSSFAQRVESRLDGQPAPRSWFSSRPNKPSDAVVGHWQHGSLHVYIRKKGKSAKGHARLVMQRVYKDGTIGEPDPFLVEQENPSTGEMKVYRETSRDGVHPKWTFSPDRMTASEDRTDHVRNALTLGPGTSLVYDWKYVDSASEPP